MSQSKAYSAQSPTSRLAPTQIPRRQPGERDVEIEILFCGICHSDVHAVARHRAERTGQAEQREACDDHATQLPVRTRLSPGTCCARSSAAATRSFGTP